MLVILFTCDVDNVRGDERRRGTVARVLAIPPPVGYCPPGQCQSKLHACLRTEGDHFYGAHTPFEVADRRGALVMVSVMHLFYH